MAVWLLNRPPKFRWFILWLTIFPQSTTEIRWPISDKCFSFADSHRISVVVRWLTITPKSTTDIRWPILYDVFLTEIKNRILVAVRWLLIKLKSTTEFLGLFGGWVDKFLFFVNFWLFRNQPPKFGGCSVTKRPPKFRWLIFGGCLLNRRQPPNFGWCFSFF